MLQRFAKQDEALSCDVSSYYALYLKSLKIQEYRTIG